MLSVASDIFIKYSRGVVLVTFILLPAGAWGAEDLLARVHHRYADSSGVKIHYAHLDGPSAGAPLAVFVHGFPDYWYSWRNQMDAVAKTHEVAALDLRGYNLSDKPTGVENYDMKLLIGDVLSVIKACGKERAVVIGHDWGGAIAWSVAMYASQVVERLIIVNLPHMNGLRRELANNPEQQKNSAYARAFQEPDALLKVTADGLARMAPEAVRPQYLEAFRLSSIEAMLNYYKRNYPRAPYAVATSEELASTPRVKCRVLQFHGLKDTALLPSGLNDEWKWLDEDLTLVTIPSAGHWSHWEAAELVTRTMVDWLKR
ncbi:MAG TPA: alpha/beta hydrolase [Bryobacteraceae bacterium]|nr:alpha/beta hydrolase [Bryobacteraceae bacterium]